MNGALLQETNCLKRITDRQLRERERKNERKREREKGGGAKPGAGKGMQSDEWREVCNECR